MTEILGILGGMGAEATSYFFQQIIKATPAKNDRDHIPTLIYSNSEIPDRTACILGKGESPVPEMVKAAKVLEQGGASMLFMPCFTAHNFVEAVQQEVNVPIVNLLHVLKEYIQTEYPDVTKIGLLCTTGTNQSRLFDKAFTEYEILHTDDEVQEKMVMEAIYGKGGIKAGITEGEPSHLMEDAGRTLIAQGAQILIMGCTEIPLALKEDALEVPILNPMKITAQYIVKRMKPELVK